MSQSHKVIDIFQIQGTMFRVSTLNDDNGFPVFTAYAGTPRDKGTRITHPSDTFETLGGAYYAILKYLEGAR